MKILIAGDSWGCGEWGWDSEGNYGLIHNGLEHFLSIDHTVINVSKAGASNKETIELLNQYLTIDKTVDLIFWFQTDPLRDARPYSFFNQKILSFETLMELQLDLILSSYTRLNNLKLPVCCLGGASTLQTEYFKHYSNLTPIVPSVTNLILGKSYDHPKIWFSEWFKLIKNQFDLASLNKLYDEKLKQNQLLDNHRDMFYPDGYHPNRIAHEILYNYLKKELEFI